MLRMDLASVPHRSKLPPGGVVKKKEDKSDEDVARQRLRAFEGYVYKWILDDDGNPLPLGNTDADLMRWCRWMETDRHVAEDYVGDIHISTMFLGLNHNHFGKGPPVLWETMIFGGEHDQYQARYRSKRAALAGHARALALVEIKLATDEPDTEDDDE